MQGTVRCGCGAVNAAAAQFCGNCGKRLRQEPVGGVRQKRCKFCQKEMPHWWEFCTGCGRIFPRVNWVLFSLVLLWLAIGAIYSLSQTGTFNPVEGLRLLLLRWLSRG